MKQIAGILFFTVLLFTSAVKAEDDLAASLNEIDTLLLKGMQENYQPSGMDLVKKSLDLCVTLAETHPDNYEVLWRCARSSAQYTEAAFGLQTSQWKQISLEWGKKGMVFGDKAQKIDPQRVEAYYWQLHSLGRYAKVTGLLTALREGFKGMSDNSIKKIYEIDKSYLDYSPLYMMAMRAYEMPPLIGKSKKDAKKYYEEMKANTKWQWESHIRYPNLAEMLLWLDEDQYTADAKKYLELELSDPHPRPVYIEMARELMKKIQK